MTRTAAVLAAAALPTLVETLRADGYRVIGPVVRDGAIGLGELDSADALATGWGVTVDAGSYRLRRRADGAVFAHAAGPQSWKSYLHPERERLWSADRTDGDTFTIDDTAESEPPLAFVGVRACDLAAIARLDRVLGLGRFPDSAYARRRAQLFVVSVGCTEPAPTCFCASTGSGPRATTSYDLDLIERTESHDFVVTVGSDAGDRILARVPHRSATAGDVERAAASVDDAATRMQRAVPSVGLRELLEDRRDSARWETIAQRCLTCGNCTMVCPTCFCTTVSDTTDLTGDHAERWRRWTSCFDIDFSYIHGGAVRTSAASRYRQWLTHKLGTWHDQFGDAGCVGCGRCIVWCPVGIDLTEEVAGLRREAGWHDAAE